MLNLIISRSKSFEAGRQGEGAYFKSEASIIDTLQELGFIRHAYRDPQTGMVNISHMWYSVDDTEQNGLFVFVCPDRWHATVLKDGEYNLA